MHLSFNTKSLELNKLQWKCLEWFFGIPFTTEKNVYCWSFLFFFFFFFFFSHQFHVLRSFSNFGTCCCVFCVLTGKTLKCDAISEWLPLNDVWSDRIERPCSELLLFVSITWFSPVVPLYKIINTQLGITYIHNPKW